ncbi:MAG: glycosyltransferase [Proteobacteria bacterium]|nr:glycosyltransferase [Pseudomonadota bacterium]MBU1640694.1 glycosyltransferase [Pseudomonadota bacterium]
MNDLCVCILAHNEQKHIAETVRAIAENCQGLACEIKVYANGCTDSTADIVRDLCQSLPNLELRELSQPSKVKAWNAAFTENRHAILVFSDGDVVPEAGAIEALSRLLSSEPRTATLVGCSFWPRFRGLGLGQRFTGFLQIPLKQDFLAGGLYAVHRPSLAREFAKRNISGIPNGVTADDTFLQLLVAKEHFHIIRHRVFYEPPQLSDYWKYLARIRWQEEQLAKIFGGVLAGQDKQDNTFAERCRAKFAGNQVGGRLLLGLVAATLRTVMKAFYVKKIEGCFQALGPVGNEGGNILSRSTRSQSAK